MSKNISLEKSLLAYKVMHTPTEFSWKQYWAKETFKNDELFKCSEEEQKQFQARLEECYLTLMPNSFLVEGAFRHAAMERGRKAKLPVRNPWLMALSVRSFDLALIIQDMIRSGIIPDFDADDPPKK